VARASTLASGSKQQAQRRRSRHKLGLVDKNITVHCPGGVIKIEIRDDFDILMTGKRDESFRRRDFAGNFRLKNHSRQSAPVF